MDMVTVPVSVPKGLIPFLDDSDQNRSFERNAMLLYPFIKNLAISHGRAAEILGVNKLDLIDYYCSMGIPYLNQSVEELEEELKDIRDFEGTKS